MIHESKFNLITLLIYNSINKVKNNFILFTTKVA